MKYAVIEFPSIDIGLEHYLKGKDLFSTRCSCLNRSDRNPTVSLTICLSDVSDHLYQAFVKTLPDITKIGYINLS